MHADGDSDIGPEGAPGVGARGESDVEAEDESEIGADGDSDQDLEREDKMREGTTAASDSDQEEQEADIGEGALGEGDVGEGQLEGGLLPVDEEESLELGKNDEAQLSEPSAGSEDSTAVELARGDNEDGTTEQEVAGHEAIGQAGLVQDVTSQVQKQEESKDALLSPAPPKPKSPLKRQKEEVPLYAARDAEIRRQYLSQEESNAAAVLVDAVDQLFDLPELPENPFFFVANVLSRHQYQEDDWETQRRGVGTVPSSCCPVALVIPGSSTTQAPRLTVMGMYLCCCIMLGLCINVTCYCFVAEDAV
eukprot:gene26098-31963_t